MAVAGVGPVIAGWKSKTKVFGRKRAWNQEGREKGDASILKKESRIDQQNDKFTVHNFHNEQKVQYAVSPGDILLMIFDVYRVIKSQSHCNDCLPVGPVGSRHDFRRDLRGFSSYDQADQLRGGQNLRKAL